MNIAITGGTGFVGRHLARRLTACGHGVVLVARGRDARDPAIRALPGARFVPTDLSDPDAPSEPRAWRASSTFEPDLGL